MNPFIKKYGLLYGGIIGAVAVSFQLLIYFSNVRLYQNLFLGFSLYVVYWGIRFFLAVKIKKVFNNEISFKEVFTCLFVASTMGIVISSLFNFVFYNYVALQLGSEINNFMNSMIIKNYKLSGKSISELEAVSKTLNFSFSSLFKTCLFSILISAIFNLILSAFFKSKTSNQL